ncbi:MAG TPA: tRNA epoxyqueuosine(34) reductase QueG [Candidatus Saccharimonadales bacterium]|nr:tRNA epoxyqueuosine(34) reductase QueG [Candidatus Saccharimonadales bacterium]
MQSSTAELSEKIKEAAQQLGFALVGISPVMSPPHEESFARWLRRELAGELEYMRRTESLRRDPRRLVPWAKSVISVGMNYYTAFPRPSMSTQPNGWISRYAWGEDYHNVIKRRMESLLERIRIIHGTPVEGRPFVDGGPVLERDFAGVAGLGWIGKNTQLISPKKGSWFFLGELFVDLPLTYDRPLRDRCGKCDLCLKACPTGAFVGPYVLDARRCISYLTIELKGFIPRHLRPLIGDHIFGCDICQEVCPYNVKAEPTTDQAYQPKTGLHAPQLIPLLSLDQEAFRIRFHGSPILRAKRRGLLRNVAVALGNIQSPEALPALIGALDDDEALVRGHVAWALGRIGGAQAAAALQRRLVTEQDGEVIGEIKEALGEFATDPA